MSTNYDGATPLRPGQHRAGDDDTSVNMFASLDDVLPGVSVEKEKPKSIRDMMRTISNSEVGYALAVLGAAFVGFFLVAFWIWSFVALFIDGHALSGIAVLSLGAATFTTVIMSAMHINDRNKNRRQ